MSPNFAPPWRQTPTRNDESAVPGGAGRQACSGDIPTMPPAKLINLTTWVFYALEKR